MEKKQPTMFESLLNVQKSLKTVVKDKKAFKGTYATIEHVWESIREVINDNGFVVYHQNTLEGTKTVALHESGEFLESFIPWSGNKDSQEQGKEITYSKRYNINAIFNIIVADEDNDATKKLGNYSKIGSLGTLAAKKLLDAKTEQEARAVYATLSEDERKTDEVVSAIGSIKEKFSIN